MSDRNASPSRGVRRRAHYPNLSPTRPPAVGPDRALWPAWTRVPIELLGYRIDSGARVKKGGA